MIHPEDFANKDQSFAHEPVRNVDLEPITSVGTGGDDREQPSRNIVALDRRHLCPQCPIGTVPLSATQLMSRSRHADAQFCCPTRKTVTKLYTKTSIKIITSRTTVFTTVAPKVPVVIAGVV